MILIYFRCNDGYTGPTCAQVDPCTNTNGTSLCSEDSTCVAIHTADVGVKEEKSLYSCVCKPRQEYNTSSKSHFFPPSRDSLQTFKGLINSANRCEPTDNSFCLDPAGLPYCKMDSPCLRCEANNPLCTEDEKKRGYRCICPRGYLPPHCKDKPAPCEGHQCMNGAICVPIPDNDGDYIFDDYRCYCTKGWGGRRCEIIEEICEAIGRLTS